jgi:hypothetical protein
MCICSISSGNCKKKIGFYFRREEPQIPLYLALCRFDSGSRHYSKQKAVKTEISEKTGFLVAQQHFLDNSASRFTANSKLACAQTAEFAAV